MTDDVDNLLVPGPGTPASTGRWAGSGSGLVRLAVVALALALSGCSFPADTPADGPRRFQELLNTNLPATATGFEAHLHRNGALDPWTWGYFTYRLDRKSLNELLRHQKFPEISPEASHWNRPFTPEPLAYILKDLDLPGYNKRLPGNLVISPKHCIAYRGVFFPMQHTIIYDTLTTDTYHFVAEMRD